MDPDQYQQAWQAHSSQARVTVDVDLLLKEVRRNQRAFRAMIFCRDFREVVVALVLIPVWFYLGARTSSPWTWYLTVPALIWIIGFFLVDRMRHRQTRSEPGEPLLASVKESLAQVEHQIWLLRNVFWWYLLPLTISIQTFFAHVALSSAKIWFVALVLATPLFVFVAALYSLIDYLNQLAIRSQLGPRRQELIALLASLGDESAAALATMSGAKSVENSRIFRRWLIVAVSSLAIFVIFVLARALFDSSHDQPPRSSGSAGDSLARSITDLRKEKNLVGLAAVVMVDGHVEAAAAVGERKHGSGVRLESGDRWQSSTVMLSRSRTANSASVDARPCQTNRRCERSSILMESLAGFAPLSRL